MSDDQASRPPRRPRYHGTHPKRLNEKYKELAPTQYPEEIVKVRSQGKTPAGSHVPVMLAEVVAALAPRPGEVALDCTLGAGGHAAALAAAVAPGGFVLGLDADGEELSRTSARLLTTGLDVRARHANFAGAAKALAAEGVASADLILADLGVSSMQLDRAERGFSVKLDAPLDLRLDRSRGKPAAEWLATQDAASLAEVFRRFADLPEKDAARLGSMLAAWRLSGRGPIRTKDLADMVLRAREWGPTPDEPTAFTSHPAARVFQALRIAVNREFESLSALLRDLPYLVKPKARVAILTFHSGEDALVEAAFAEGLAAGHWKRVGAPLSPSRDEVFGNPRSRSARLRTAFAP